MCACVKQIQNFTYFFAHSYAKMSSQFLFYRSIDEHVISVTHQFTYDDKQINLPAKEMKEKNISVIAISELFLCKMPTKYPYNQIT